MNKKITLDIVMTIIMIVLMRLFFTGILWHEVLGLVVFCLFILHKYWNWSFIKNVTKNILRGKINKKVAINYFLDWFIFIDTALIIISGILISDKLFPYLNASNIALWSMWHHFFSYLGLALISIHIGMHLEVIVNQFKRMLKINYILPSFIKNIVVLLLLFFGIKSVYDSRMIEYAIKPFDKDSYAKDCVLHTTAAIEKFTAAATPSLKEYLGSFRCDGCSKHCPLSAPQCGIGEQKAASATVVYQQKYAVNNTPDTTTSNSTEPPTKTTATTTKTTTTASNTTTTASKTKAAPDEEVEHEAEIEEVEEVKTPKVMVPEDSIITIAKPKETSIIEIGGIMSLFGVAGNFIKKYFFKN